MSNRCVTKACWELRAYPSGRCVFCEAQTFPLKLCQSCTARASQSRLTWWDGTESPEQMRRISLGQIAIAKEIYHPIRACPEGGEVQYPTGTHLVRSLTIPSTFPKEVRIYEAPDLPGAWIAENSQTGDITQGRSPDHALFMYEEMMSLLQTRNI